MADRHPIIQITVPAGQTVLVDTESGHRILIVDRDSDYYVKGNEANVLIMVEHPGGKSEILYGSTWGAPEPTDEEMSGPDEKMAAEIIQNLGWTEQEPSSDLHEEMAKIARMGSESQEKMPEKTFETQRYEMAPASLDAMLAAAVVPGPTPAELVLRASSDSSASQAAPAPAAPLAPLESVVAAHSEPTQPAAAPPPGTQPMDKAPRDGSYVALVSSGDTVIGRWQPHLGRQFWVDENGDTLGADSTFTSWRHPTQAEKEEFGIV